MENLIINEWFLHDLNGDNGKDRLRETARVLLFLIEKNTFRIFVAKDSPWMDKARKMATNHKEPTKRLMHLLFSNVIRDSKKCKLIATSELPDISQEMFAHVPQEDTYLIKLSMKAAPCVLVSTDHELVNSLKKFEQNTKVTPLLRNEWLSRII